tara:strand:+ start:424 stop:618 length:195 start_codon:yes stop_codon:yes gene_type:complete
MSVVMTCKERGYHSWDMAHFDMDDSFDEVSITLSCSVCDAEVEMTGDVRTSDGCYIEYAVEEEE